VHTAVHLPISVRYSSITRQLHIASGQSKQLKGAQHGTRSSDADGRRVHEAERARERHYVARGVRQSTHAGRTGRHEGVGLSPLVQSPRTARRRARQRTRWLATSTVVSIAAGCLIVGGQANGATTSWQVVVDDSFARNVDSGWGSATQGGEWTVRTESGGSSSVSPGSATLTVDPGKSAEATVVQSTVGDVQAQVSFTLPKDAAAGYGVHEAVQVRRQPTGDAYRARIKVGSNGRAVLALSRWSGSNDTALSNVALPFSVASGAETTLRVQVTGESPVTLEAKAWPRGTAEPGWQSTVTDSSSARLTAAGAVGLWTYVLSAASRTTVLTTGFTAWKATATAPTPGIPAPPVPDPPAPAPVPTTGEAIGSAPVGSTNYAVPSNALFVSASSGRDSDSGTVGSPLRSIAAAVSKATSGQTVVMRAGSYNEQVVIDKPLKLQSYPREAVWLDGSDPVSDWSQSGSTWVAPWNSQFNHSNDSSGNNASRFINPAYPMAAWPDQVFIDGSPLQQVGSAGEVTANSFFVDYGSRTLRIGRSPSGHDVRASDKTQAIYTTAAGVKLQGFGVRRYATQLSDSGTVRIGNAASLVQNLVITDNAMLGLSVRNDNNRVENVTVSRNGQLGIGANASYGLRIADSVVEGNNTQHFKSAPVAGGVKITRARGVSIIHNNVSNNIDSTGIWCDESCYDIDVASNTVSGNGAAGLELELSDTAIVANNQLVGNHVGALIFDTGNVRLYNNEFGRSGLISLQLKQDARRASNTSATGHDSRQPNPDPTVPWITKNITVSNNVFGTGGQYQIYAMDNVSGWSADNMRPTITGNLFNRWLSSGQTKMVGWGGSDNRSVTNFQTPEALAAAKNSSWRNAAVNPSTDIYAMASAAVSNVGVAQGLPSDIAALLEQPAGVQHLGMF